MKEFTIAEEFMTSVATRETWNTYTRGGREPTPAELLLLLEGKGVYSMTGTADHPEFAKLRDKLEAGKFIRTCRNSWNGDYVIKSFKLNDRIFKANDRFLCGSAIKSDFKRK